ncbi:hypothetical protein M23134_07016 [Microscilla marina ATCC 23134]|uniref:Secretion system C-terminal sorting domain-containing protein n=2 Tax=Microscilla marina TaxID=1027 RepID=A1ZT31_MICM2|nr:hypothetical protein M23134_07016 [Microscilla marina ATCC 23134]
MTYNSKSGKLRDKILNIMKRFIHVVLVMILATIGYTAQAQSNLKRISVKASDKVVKATPVTAALHSEGKRVSINTTNSQDKIYNVKIKNTAGVPHQSYTCKAGKQNIEMDLRILPKGNYLLAITTKNKEFITYEFSKR